MRSIAPAGVIDNLEGKIQPGRRGRFAIQSCQSLQNHANPQRSQGRRDEGADRLTLGNLAIRAGVSKPVVYEHFGTRSGLLIELYRWIDTERVSAFQAAMAAETRGREETIRLLATTYIHCATDITDDFHTVGPALAGSEEKAAVFQELLNNVIMMFVAVLKPFDTLPAGELEKRCIGFVGAGEALSSALVRGTLDARDAEAVFAALISGGMAAC